MEPSDTQLVRLERAGDEQREGESFEPSGRAAAEAPWGAARKVAFRFAFSYLALYLCPFSAPVWFVWQIRWSPGYETLWHKIVPWFAAHILHLSYPVTVFVSTGSDTTYDYVKVLCDALIAAVATVVWSVIDHKRIAYSKLDQWLRLYVRVVVASAMLLYGLVKVIPEQMPPPGLVTLMQPFGDLAPFRLLWSFIGASSLYESSCGAVEMLGGVLLLIPSMTMLGALVALAAMAQVFLLNICYNVPVKLWAAHLMVFAAFLLLPDVRRLVNLFVLNRGAEPERRRPLFRRRWLNYTVWGIQWALGIHLIVNYLSVASASVHQINNAPQTNPLYGIWSVDTFTVDGQTRPPLLTDNLRWQRVIFDSDVRVSPMVATIQGMNGQLSSYAAIVDSHNSTLSLKSPPDSIAELYDAHNILSLKSSRGQDGNAELNYNRPQPDAMILEGVINGHRLDVTLKKEERQFLLKTHWFQWINDSI
jgi:uncharacterized membrane protein YphA (DoxX/SURF4 family)